MIAGAAHGRRFRFGVQLVATPDGPAWRRLARQAEDLGYSTLFLPDHFGDHLAPLAAMMAAADATTSLRVGTLVLANDYRHPVVLAKEAATIDNLSTGRLELGLGAGWMNVDYEQSGLAMSSAGTRIERLAESVTVIRGLFGDRPFSFDGAHYRISHLDLVPKPVQRPGPPIILGGGGRRMLELAGRLADVVAINPAVPSGVIDASVAPELSAEAVDRKIGWVRAAAGQRYRDLEVSNLVGVCMLDGNRSTSAERVASAYSSTVEDVLTSPYSWIGPVSSVADDLEARRARWDLSYIVVQGEEAMIGAAPIVARLSGS